MRRNDHDGASGVMRTLLPDRSKKQARELTTAVRADDEQVVRLRCAHELTGRRPFEPARARRASSEPSTPTTILSVLMTSPCDVVMYPLQTLTAPVSRVLRHESADGPSMGNNPRRRRQDCGCGIRLAPSAATCMRFDPRTR